MVILIVLVGLWVFIRHFSLRRARLGFQVLLLASGVGLNRYLAFEGLPPESAKAYYLVWLIAGAFVLEVLVWHQRTTWSRTPYEQIIARISPTQPARAPLGKTFDIFVSYKSEDVPVVRQVADQMIASGLRVWFAEYTVLLTGREQFQEYIDAGIGQSRYGVCFTNDRFIGSEYCRREMEQLLDPANCGPENVVEVRIPSEPLPHREYPELASAPAIEFTGDVNELLRYVQAATSLSVELPAPAMTGEEAGVVFRDEELGYSFDVTGWRMMERGGGHTGADIQGPSFSRSFPGSDAVWNLIVGPDAVAPRQVKGESVDDRQAYERGIEFAERYLGREGRKCAGVHLFFLHGFSHLALTYWWRNGWTRRYSIILPEPGTGRSMEFAFSFAFFGPFAEYCRRAHHMDRIVNSLEWL